MRFHVVGLPHTETNWSYVHCAYTAKVIKFCAMMMSLGHEVYLYGAENNKAECTEFISCISREEQRTMIGIETPTDNGKVDFGSDTDYWKLMNGRAIEAIKERQEKQDFLCVIAGFRQQPIANDIPDMMCVEYGIGYEGWFSNFKVFESYAWMHACYGARYGASAADGNYFDTVIPNYYDPKDFPFSDEPDDYFLFVGRLIDRKGWRIAQEVCEKAGHKLIVAGQGDFSGYGEYVGTVGVEERGKLMSKARGLFVPTRYLGPFEGVHAEAMLCGTPVITSNFGVFTETVKQGADGYRCDMFEDFVAASLGVDYLDNKAISKRAVDRFSIDNVKYMYENYFYRLLTLYGDGWYAKSY